MGRMTEQRRFLFVCVFEGVCLHETEKKKDDESFFLKGVVCTVSVSEMNGKEKKKKVYFSTLIYT